MRVVPINAVGVVGRDGDLMLAALAWTNAGFRGVDHIVSENTWADFLGVYVQAVKVQVGAVLVVEIAQRRLIGIFAGRALTSSIRNVSPSFTCSVGPGVVPL